MRRRIDESQGMELVRAYASGTELSRAQLATAVRFALEEFATRHPGRSVEIRVPWVGAVQAIAGPVHTRGTPPNVVELDGGTWLDATLGRPVDESKISHSGTRADLGPYFPLFGRAQLAAPTQLAAPAQPASPGRKDDRDEGPGRAEPENVEPGQASPGPAEPGRTRPGVRR
ncbi:sterol carrier family protein [Trueperella sp.]|uniref:sterol carrier family protein n=1 Tax=Trueperella sp. TaxID=2699835 RepID=UPI0022EA6F61|nr:sterol carrier family protein [Trueperella sp.]